MWKDVVPLAAIYAYFTGWVYAYYYWTTFGLRLSRLDIPVYYLIVYAFPVLYTWSGMLALLAGTGLVVWLREHRFLASIVLIAIFPALYHLALRRGIEGALSHQRIDTRERIEFTFADPAHLSPALVYNNEQQNLRPLIETSDAYIVFFQPPAEGGVLPGMVVFTVKKTDVTTVTNRSSEESN